MKSNQENGDFEKDLKFVVENRDTYEFMDKLDDIHRRKSRPKRIFFINDYLRYGVAALLIIGIGISVFVLIRQSRKPLHEKVFNKYYAAYYYVNYRGDNTDPKNLLMKGTDYVNEGNFEAAQAVSRKILAKDPDNAEARFLSGVSMLGMQKFQQALRQFDKVIHADSGYFHEYAEWYKALILIKLQRLDEAIFVLDSIKFEKGPFAGKAEEILDTLHSAR